MPHFKSSNEGKNKFKKWFLNPWWKIDPIIYFPFVFTSPKNPQKCSRQKKRIEEKCLIKAFLV
jgi:hypothetical protein